MHDKLDATHFKPRHMNISESSGSSFVHFSSGNKVILIYRKSRFVLKIKCSIIVETYWSVERKFLPFSFNQAMLVSSFKLYVAPIRIINNIVGITGEIHGCIVFQENVCMTGRRLTARKCGSIQVVNQTDFSFSLSLVEP